MERRVVELAATLPELTHEQQCAMLKCADYDMNDWMYVPVTLAQRYEEFQVFRVFQVIVRNGNSRNYYAPCPYNAEHKVFEVQGELYQIWMNEQGKTAILSHPICMFPTKVRPAFIWRMRDEMSIKCDRYETYEHRKFYCTTDWFLVDSWHPTLLRNLGGKMPENYDARYICEAVLADPFMETLYKQHYDDWFKVLMQHKEHLKTYIPAVKIAIRKHYTPKSIHTWLDHIRILNELGKDLHNPFYVCPADLDGEHRKYYAQYERLMAKRAEEKRQKELRAKLEKEKQRVKLYADRISPFLTLAWHTDQYAVFVCPSVEDMVEEGQKMHHCVGSMGYDKKPDSLILFCRTPNGDRISTIEYSISQGKVLQNRAACNKVPLYMDEVNKMLEADADKIRKCKLINIKNAAPVRMAA